MNITNQENELFNKWKKKADRTPFVLDGAPSPQDYVASKTKVVFMLKDANLGNYKENEYDLRKYLFQSPDSWWRKIAAWCLVLIDLNKPEPDWIELNQIDLRNTLKHFVFLQIKKKGGYGSVDDKLIKRIAFEDKSEIIEQLQIYKPRIIVCGNVGSILATILECGERRITPKGIGYWATTRFGKTTFLIDYCHPSIRASNKVIPPISYGLRDACVWLLNSSEEKV